MLRDYRDNYLASLPNGKELIEKYYDVAPTIVKHIDQRADAKEIYCSIWEEYLSPCISLIESGQMETCRKRYEEMVYTLRDKYFIQ